MNTTEQIRDLLDSPLCTVNMVPESVTHPDLRLQVETSKGESVHEFCHGRDKVKLLTLTEAMEWRGWYWIYSLADDILLQHKVTFNVLLNPNLAELLDTHTVIELMIGVMARSALNMDEFHKDYTGC